MYHALRRGSTKPFNMVGSPNFNFKNQIHKIILRIFPIINKQFPVVDTTALSKVVSLLDFLVTMFKSTESISKGSTQSR